MLLCVIIYMAVAAAAVGAISYTVFADSPEPLALILRELNQPWAAWFLAVSAVIALPTVILAFFFGQSRIFFTMARDGLLPPALAKVSSRGSASVPRARPSPFRLTGVVVPGSTQPKPRVLS